jgi:hypothetical protein
MIDKLKLFTLILMALTISITACRKSDSEMERALVGTWNQTTCPLTTPDDNSDQFWFIGFVTFRSDGSFTESASWLFCKDSCENPLSDPAEYCTCSYIVQDRHLVITPGAENPEGHWVGSNFPYLTEIPIKKISEKRLILDNGSVGGIEIDCTCFEKE